MLELDEIAGTQDFRSLDLSLWETAIKLGEMGEKSQQMEGRISSAVRYMKRLICLPTRWFGNHQLSLCHFLGSSANADTIELDF
jgi:hypothetical protein